MAQAEHLFINQITKQRALSFYCRVAAFASFAIVPLAVAETCAALQCLQGSGVARQFSSITDSANCCQGGRADKWRRSCSVAPVGTCGVLYTEDAMGVSQY